MKTSTRFRLAVFSDMAWNGFFLCFFTGSLMSWASMQLLDLSRVPWPCAVLILVGVALAIFAAISDTLTTARRFYSSQRKKRQATGRRIP